MKEFGVNDTSWPWQRWKAPWNQKTVANSGCLLGCKFSVFKHSLCSLTAYPPSFVRWPLLLSDQHSQAPQGDTQQSSLLRPDLPQPGGLVRDDLNWRFFSLVTWNDENFSGGQNINWPVKWHSSSWLNWKLVFRGSWWKLCFDFELRNAGGAMGRGREKDSIFFLPGITAFLLCSLSFPGPRGLNLVWGRLRDTLRRWCRCSWCGLYREGRSALLWMSHNYIPESFFPPAALSRGLLAEALLTIRLQELVDGVKRRLSPLRFPGLGSSGMVQTHCQTQERVLRQNWSHSAFWSFADGGVLARHVKNATSAGQS